MPSYMAQWAEQGGLISLALDHANIPAQVRTSFVEAFGFDEDEVLETLAEVLPEEFEAALSTIHVDGELLTIAMKGRLRRVFKMASLFVAAGTQPAQPSQPQGPTPSPPTPQLTLPTQRVDADLATHPAVVGFPDDAPPQPVGERDDELPPRPSTSTAGHRCTPCLDLSKKRGCTNSHAMTTTETGTKHYNRRDYQLPAHSAMEEFLFEARLRLMRWSSDARE